MATLYVYHGGSNTAPYDSWANAATTFGTAVSAAAAGDTIIVASDHSETVGNQSYTIPGSSTAPTKVYSANRTTNAFEKAASPQITSTGSLTVYGVARFAGLNLQSEAFNNGDNGDIQVWEECTISANGFVQAPQSYTNVIWRKVDFTQNSSSHVFSFVTTGVAWLFDKCTINNPSGSSTRGLNCGANGITIRFRDCDFSNYTAGKLFDVNNLTYGSLVAENCVLNSATTQLFDVEPYRNAFQDLQCVFVDSGNVPYIALYQAQGNAQTDTGIYRTSAGSVSGTQQSLACSTNTKAEFFLPLEIRLWSGVVDTSTAKTFTVEFAQDGPTTALTNEDIWIEVEYPDDTTTLGLREGNRKATFTDTATAHPDSTESWTGLSGTNKRQKMSVTTTQAGKSGVCTVWLYVAKPSITVYVDPDVTVA